MNERIRGSSKIMFSINLCIFMSFMNIKIPIHPLTNINRNVYDIKPTVQVLCKSWAGRNSTTQGFS